MTDGNTEEFLVDFRWVQEETSPMATRTRGVGGGRPLTRGEGGAWGGLGWKACEILEMRNSSVSRRKSLLWRVVALRNCKYPWQQQQSGKDGSFAHVNIALIWDVRIMSKKVSFFIVFPIDVLIKEAANKQILVDQLFLCFLLYSYQTKNSLLLYQWYYYEQLEMRTSLNRIAFF